MLATAVFVPVALIWEPDLASVVAATLVAICLWATVAGAALPFLARRLRAPDLLRLRPPRTRV